MAGLDLNYGNYQLVPEGEVVLKIKSAKAVPAANPRKIIVELESFNGGSTKETYDLSNKTAVFAFTMLLSKATGYTGANIDLDTLGDVMNNKFVKCEVKHTVTDKVKDGVLVPNETTTFVNIKKTLAGANGFEEDTNINTVDDIDDINLDDDDEDDLPI